MSYAIRNTLVLAILFILVAAGGGYWVFSRQLGELKGIRQDQDEVSREIEEMGDVHAVLEEITAKLEEAKERWRHREKVIPPVDNPADTYAYLNRIVSRTGTAMYVFSEGATGKRSRHGRRRLPVRCPAGRQHA